jgi:ribosomal protein L11 methyltransferase
VVSGFPAPPKLGTSEGASRIVIVIQPSMGFGTGHHATTRLCLAALQALDLAGRSVIDVGTGSGVLAIAGSLLGADRVLAIDDDPDAIQAARENVALNSGASVDVRLSDLRALASSALHASLAPDPATVAHADSHARFDVIFANLTGTLLSQTAALLEQLAVRDGSLVLSGFMRHEADDVLAAFSGCELRASSEEDEWLCVTLQSR